MLVKSMSRKKDDCKKIIPLSFDSNWKCSKVPSEMIHTHVEKVSLVPKLENLFRSIVAVNLAISARNLFKVINTRSMKKDNLDASHKFKVLDCIMKMSTLNKKKIFPFDRGRLNNVKSMDSYDKTIYQYKRSNGNVW